MIPVQRLGHLTLETDDIEKSVAYYVNVNGLVVVDKTANTVHLASRIGQLSITLVKSDRNDCTRISFEVPPDADFDAIGKVLADEGISSEVRSDPFPGTPGALVFRDPKGTEIELFSAWSFLCDTQNVAGIGPNKLGHVAFYVPDIQSIVAFYQRVLGFRVSDWLGDFFVFMRCNADHHAVNFFSASRAALHHFAFELRDFPHIQQGCETLALARLPLTWGPMRHGPGNNLAVYHRNPEGHIIEYYCELDQMKNEALGYFEPRPWHTDRPQRPKVWEPGKWISGWGVPPTKEQTKGISDELLTSRISASTVRG